MGAEVFEVEANGKDMKEAFQFAVDTAFYDWGHSGYTGTIAEKPGAYLIPTPAGVLAQDVKNMIEKAQRWDDFYTWPNQTPEQKAKQDEYLSESKEAFKQVVKWYGEDEASKIVKKSDAKWDEAIAIELTDDEHPKDGERWFLFFGWASS